MEPIFSIAEVAEITGLSQDTLRYYEKIKLLPSTKRKENGQREYSKLDLDRVRFVTILRRTHMPLRKINEYMNNSSIKNYEECYSLLNEHKTLIETQMAEMATTLDILKHKLKNFEELKEGNFLDAEYDK
ncbi:MerR family transcriptional regulator [Paenibacillus sp. LC-T2]|uniref:MerR family transcriptional regulator n=1 Tax=Paenibacillus monticola TaxID=2666075 RepID=A0A7X2H8R4_9BACL|nr:MerR family transcriptional regulator [Paenibacillus monticola]